MELPDPVDEPPPREPRGLEKFFAQAGVWLRARMGRSAVALPTIVFALGWLYLNAFAGSTWPIGTSGFPAYLAPSPEATAALAVVCAIVWIGRKPHALLFFALAAVVLIARLLHTADALVREAFDRPFVLSRDAGLIWELFILLDDTIDRVTLIAYMAGSAIVFGLLVFLAKQSFAIARSYFVDRVHRILFASLAGGLALLSLGLGDGPYQPSPIAAALAHAPTDDPAPRERAESVRSELRAGPHGLEKLDGRDVYLVHVPSYGRVLVDEAEYRSRIAPAWEETARALAEDGWIVRSSSLDAPARRGLPWLSHLTLATGVRTSDQASFDALLEAEPDTLATLFREAGHRTARMLPGVSRERPEREIPGYGMQYRGWELGYLGVPFGRAQVPDQFALWRAWEREVEPSDEGVFVDVVFAAVEPPYDARPPYVEDWATLGTGEIYRSLAPVEHETSFEHLELAAPAWIDALTYELRVLRGYLVDLLPDPPERPRRSRRRVGKDYSPLVIVVGSSQPPGPLARDADTDAVIVHAIARDEALLAPFAEAGFTDGMIPTAAPPGRGMETFMPWLVRAFSGTE